MKKITCLALIVWLLFSTVQICSTQPVGIKVASFDNEAARDTQEGNSDQSLGSNFTIPTEYDGYILESVSFYCSRYNDSGALTGDLYAYLWQNDNGMPSDLNDLLATSNPINVTPAENFPAWATFGWVNWTFSGSDRVALVGGRSYTVTLDDGGTGVESGANDIYKGQDSDGGFAEGNYVYCIDLTDYDDWFDSGSSFEMLFRVWASEPPTPAFDFPLNIATPYAFAAISIMSLALIVGVGAGIIVAFREESPSALLPLSLMGIGIFIALFVSLVILSGFSGL